MLKVIPCFKKFFVTAKTTYIFRRTSPRACKYYRVTKLIIFNGFFQFNFMSPIIAKVINVLKGLIFFQIVINFDRLRLSNGCFNYPGYNAMRVFFLVGFLLLYLAE